MRRERSATTGDGVRLYAEEWGPEGAPVVVCLPGLTRNGRDFATLAAALCEGGDGAAHRVLVLDSRGRGRSGRAPAKTYTLVQELADLKMILDALGIAEASFVGTSRGGLLTMLLAATEPGRVRKAVLNDIGPVIEAAGLARIADSVGAKMEYGSFEELAIHLRATLGAQFPGLSDAHFVRKARQLARECNGRVLLDYDPSLAEPFRTASAAAAPDFWPAFEALANTPLLVIRGAHSDILSAATVEAMRRHVTGMRTLVAVNEGHAPLLWDRHSIETVKAFLAE